MTLLLGLDGMAPVGTIPKDGCCPPSLCNINPCGLICNFINALPSGPLWDRPKAEAMGRFSCSTSLSLIPCTAPCGTLVDHAIYTAVRLYDALIGALAPAIWEASPYTAHAALDAWLKRLDWRDCYDCACRNGAVAGLSPIEIWGPISGDGICEGPICCPQEFSDDLQCAVKRGTVIALHRLRRLPRRTVDAINFVIAPLGARLVPVCYRDIALDPKLCNADDGKTLCYPETPPDNPCLPTPSVDPWLCDDGTPECEGSDTFGAMSAPRLRQYQFKVCPIATTLPKCPTINCQDGSAQATWDTVIAAPVDGPTVQAWYEPTPCDGGTLPAQVWPGLLAAECIARTALPRGAKINLIRC